MPEIHILTADETHTVAFGLGIAVDKYQGNKRLMDGLGQHRLAAQFAAQAEAADRLRTLIAQADAMAVYIPLETFECSVCSGEVASVDELGLCDVCSAAVGCGQGVAHG